MIIPAIKKVTVANSIMDVYEVGKDGITEIRDASIEFPDTITCVIDILKGNSLSIQLINVPLIIEHFN